MEEKNAYCWAHRIGQTKKVTVYKLIAKNTIEEKIQKLQETKKDLAEQIIDGEAASLLTPESCSYAANQRVIGCCVTSNNETLTVLVN